MPCFSQNAQKLFKNWQEEDLLAKLEEFYQMLLDVRKDAIEYGGVPEDIDPRKHVTLNLEVLQQVQLHRAERLFAAADPLLLDRNIYALALVVRGFYETTGIVGYFCNRLESLAQGNIEFENFAWNVADAIMGARHDQFSSARPPLHILTCIEKADKYLDKHLFKEKHGILMDGYNWLSEYAHPNFLSNVSAFTFEKEYHRFVFRHDDELNKSELDLMGYLSICSGLFVSLFDELSKRAVDGCLDE